MILDITTKLAAALDLTGATSTLANPILGATYLDQKVIEEWGMGADIIWYSRIGTILAAAGGSTQFVLVAGSTSAKVTTSGTPDAVIATTGVILQANYATQGAANTEFKIKIPRGSLSLAYRYWGVGAVQLSNNLTTGTLDSYLLNDAVQDLKSYPGGYTVK